MKTMITQYSCFVSVEMIFLATGTLTLMSESKVKMMKTIGDAANCVLIGRVGEAAEWNEEGIENVKKEAKKCVKEI